MHYVGLIQYLASHYFPISSFKTGTCWLSSVCLFPNSTQTDSILYLKIAVSALSENLLSTVRFADRVCSALSAECSGTQSAVSIRVLYIATKMASACFLKTILFPSRIYFRCSAVLHGLKSPAALFGPPVPGEIRAMLPSSAADNLPKHFGLGRGGGPSARDAQPFNAISVRR